MSRPSPTILEMLLLACLASGACSDDASSLPDARRFDATTTGCGAPPELLMTADEVEYVRTPSACFDGLSSSFPYEPRFVEIDGLRQAYIDEGPAGAEPILLLHGEPSWSYLYRTMIPVLVAGGHRVIAMDHIGMGRSDKPTNIGDYSYLGHVDRLEKFLDALQLEDVTLFCQDWGSLIGLHLVGNNPALFARVVVGNGALPVIPDGVEVYPPVADPNGVDDTLTLPYVFPAQQAAYYDASCEPISPPPVDPFPAWMNYAMKGASFHPAEFVEALTWFDVSAEDEAAYDAPFPSRTYMAGIRAFPSLVNEIPGQTQQAWTGLTGYDKPFLTIWGDNDPISSLGPCAVQDQLIANIPGAVAQPHTRLELASHFLQDDQGAEVARLINELIAATPLPSAAK